MSGHSLNEVAVKSSERASENSPMGLLDLLLAYLQVRPIDLWSALRLYSGYAIALVMGVAFLSHIIKLDQYGNVGKWIPGKRALLVRVDDHKVKIRPRTGDCVVFTRAYEPISRSYYQIQRGAIVIDVGAHVGSYTMLAARRASIVVAVEPGADNFSLLKTNVELNDSKNVLPLNIALSNNRGKAYLYTHVGGDPGGSSLEVPIPSGHSPREIQRTEVECDTLDHLVESIGLRRIDWLKIDVEGHEVAVLEGGTTALRMALNAIVEVQPRNEEACDSMLRDAGFIQIAVERTRSGKSSNWILRKNAPQRS